MVAQGREVSAQSAPPRRLRTMASSEEDYLPDWPEHRCLGKIPEGLQQLILTPQADSVMESLREILLRRRDTAIIACIIEIFVSMGAMALYDLRRTLLIPIGNSIL